MSEHNIYVIKRNGRGKVPLDIEKIHEMVEYACEDITGVSASEVEMNSGLQFHDGISTQDIQQILIKSAARFNIIRKTKLSICGCKTIIIWSKKINSTEDYGTTHIYLNKYKKVLS